MPPDPNNPIDLKKLSRFDLHKIWITLLDIQDSHKDRNWPHIKIYIQFGHSTDIIPTIRNTSRFRYEALYMLKKSGAIRDFNKEESILGSMIDNPELGRIRIEVDESFYYEVFEEVAELIESKQEISVKKETGSADPKPNSSVNDEIIYVVEYTPTREVLLNKIIIAKTEFDSENDNVFGFISKNPNRTITIQELAGKLGGNEPAKSLHKIVENLGFIGDLRNAFFNISKDSIMFRNPLKRSDLEAMGKGWLRITLKSPASK